MGKICVFCGASGKVDKLYLDLAKEVGQEMALRGHSLVYGGVKLGLMKAIAESMRTNDGEIQGIVQKSLAGISGNDEFNTIVPTIGDRIEKMIEISDAFLILPGGFGTLHELFEIIESKQLEMHKKPIVVLNSHGFFESMLNFIGYDVIGKRFAHPDSKNLFYIAKTTSDALNFIDNYKPPESMPNAADFAKSEL